MESINEMQTMLEWLIEQRITHALTTHSAHSAHSAHSGANSEAIEWDSIEGYIHLLISHFVFRQFHADTYPSESEFESSIKIKKMLHVHQDRSLREIENSFQLVLNRKSHTDVKLIPFTDFLIVLEDFVGALKLILAKFHHVVEFATKSLKSLEMEGGYRSAHVPGSNVPADFIADIRNQISVFGLFAVGSLTDAAHDRIARALRTQKVESVEMFVGLNARVVDFIRTSEEAAQRSCGLTATLRSIADALIAQKTLRSAQSLQRR
jgi:hypothetical protein